MLKEIHEQPEAMRETIGERLQGGRVRLELGGPGRRAAARRRARHDRRLRHRLPRGARRPLPARGVGARPGRDRRRVRDALPQPGARPARRSRSPISQSGETADTIAAQRVARAGGARILAVSNVMGSQLTREADATLYTRCGREIGVAATKTFTGQVVAFTLLALRLAELRGTIEPTRLAELRGEVAALPDLARGVPRGRDSPLWDAGRGGRAGRLPEGLLPLHRPPSRHAGVPRGRAQAEGDQLRPDRRLSRPAR